MAQRQVTILYPTSTDPAQPTTIGEPYGWVLADNGVWGWRGRVTVSGDVADQGSSGTFCAQGGEQRGSMWPGFLHPDFDDPNYESTSPFPININDLFELGWTLRGVEGETLGQLDAQDRQLVLTADYNSVPGWEWTRVSLVDSWVSTVAENFDQLRAGLAGSGVWTVDAGVYTSPSPYAGVHNRGITLPTHLLVTLLFNSTDAEPDPWEDDPGLRKNRAYPYLWFSDAIRKGATADEGDHLYAAADEGAYLNFLKGTVLSFGTFSRTLSNALFGLEIPVMRSTLMDPDRAWRLRMQPPYAQIVRRWSHCLLRTHGADDNIEDISIAATQVTDVQFPANRKVSVSSTVMTADLLGAQIPRRIISLDDWPSAPIESIGRAVPIIYGRVENTFSLPVEEDVEDDEDELDENTEEDEEEDDEEEEEEEEDDEDEDEEDEEDACTATPGDQWGGAVPCIRVDGAVSVNLVQAAGIDAAVPTHLSSPPTGAEALAFDYDGGGGRIPGGVVTYYRVTAIVNGVESRWTDEMAITHPTDLHSVIVLFNDPPEGNADSYRVYQMTTPGLVLHQDMGSVTENARYYMKQVSSAYADPVWDHQHYVKFWGIADGAPVNTMPGGGGGGGDTYEEELYSTTYVVCGHGVKKILGVWARIDNVVYKLKKGRDYRTDLTNISGNAYTILRMDKDMRSADTCTYAEVTANVLGIEDVGDGSGTLIDLGPLIVRHFLLNWVFNSYTSGPWYDDVDGAPGIIASETFDEAAEVSMQCIEGGYLGAVALVTKQELRTLLQDAITSFNLDLYYRNAIDNNGGAWCVRMFDPDADFLHVPTYTANNDIFEETFTLTVQSTQLLNVMNFRAGPKLTGEGNGWLVTGKLEEPDSIANFHRVEQDFEMLWVRHFPTALDVAGRQLRWRRYPLCYGEFQTGLRAVNVELGSILAIVHPDGLYNGWNHEPVRVIGHDFDLDQMTITIRFVSIRALMGGTFAYDSAWFMGTPPDCADMDGDGEEDE